MFYANSYFKLEQLQTNNSVLMTVSHLFSFNCLCYFTAFSHHRGHLCAEGEAKGHNYHSNKIQRSSNLFVFNTQEALNNRFHRVICDSPQWKGRSRGKKTRFCRLVNHLAGEMRAVQRNRQADDEIVHGLAANLLQRREMSTL